MGELEKMGNKYRVALRIAKDPRFERMPCTHKVRLCTLLHSNGLDVFLC
jgi:rRNA-processing protein FCF1